MCTTNYATGLAALAFEVVRVAGFVSPPEEHRPGFESCPQFNSEPILLSSSQLCPGHLTVNN